MAKPGRNASPEKVLSNARVFFATTKTSMGQRLLQSERNALLLVDVLRSNVAKGRFNLHDFVVMPDHLHVLISLPTGLTIERAMQLIKGGFSYRLKREYGFPGEVWQRGFSEVRITNPTNFAKHCKYITQNPVKAHLVDRAEDYPYCYGYLAKRKVQRLNRS